MGFFCGLEGCSIEVASKGLCGRCKDIHYCCKEHQTEDWKRHKKECKERARPKFHEEYNVAFPTDFSGFSILRKWFDRIEMMNSPVQSMMDAFQGCILNSFGPVGSILCMRWSINPSTDPDLLPFLRTEDNPLGEVWRGNPLLARSVLYGTDCTTGHMVQMQNMRNTPTLKGQLERGETYVSLGFVDLQQLMEAELIGPAEGGPVAWHGFDMNPIAVTKSKLMLAMLEEDVPLEQILQIWFSTCISLEASKSLSVFCGKLKALEKDRDSCELLDWWRRASIKADESREDWNFQRRDATFTSIPLLRNKRDRVECARYILTGEIFLAGPSQKTTGNPTFYPPPNSNYSNPTNESIYSTVDIAGDFNFEGLLLASIERRFKSNLEQLRKLIKENQVKITLSVATISADNKEVLAKIRTLAPARIDWSNIPDFFTIPDFFSIASQCSTEGTKHSFHLIKWWSKVFGANLADYVPFHENYGSEDFRLYGSFKDRQGTLPKLVKELRSELISQAQSQTQTAITQDMRTIVSSMNIMDVSVAAFSFRFCDNYMSFMFENMQLTKKEWQKADISIFDPINSRVCASFEF